MLQVSTKQLPDPEFAALLASKMAPGVLEGLLKESQYEQYQDDPVGFGENILGETYTDETKILMESVRDYPITVAISANATGKSQPINTPILTPDGYKPMGDLRAGEAVYGRNGKPTRVTGVYPQGKQPTYKVIFNDHSYTKCSEDHLWSVRSAYNKNKQKYIQHTTAELFDLLHQYLHVPMCALVEFTSKEYKVDPYIVGVLVGDGTLGQSVRFDSADEWIVTEVKKRLPKDVNVKLYRKTHYGITSPPGRPNSILEALNNYGMIGCGAKEKNVPRDYLFGDIEQRKLLLAGLMDTDGTIDARGSISFDTISPKLSKQIVWLVQSFGGTCKVSTRMPQFTHNGEKRTGQLCYRHLIKIPFCPFSLPRKVERWREPDTMQKPAHRIVDNIQYVGDEDSICISVEAEDNLYLTENFIVTHNTHGAGGLSIWWYKSFKDSQVYTAAAPPESNLKKLLWGEIGTRIEKHPDLFSSDTITTLHVQRSAQSFLTGVTIPSSGTEAQREAKFSGKHAPYLLFVIDEGDAVPDEVYRGIESCMTGGLARLLVIFNPRAEIGEVYRMIRDGRANVVKLSAFNHPNVITGTDNIPGAVTRETVVRRINEWCRTLVEGQEKPDSECFGLPNFLEGAIAKSHSGQEYSPLKPGWYKVIEPAFSYMVLGQYPAQSTQQLISREWVEKAKLRWQVYVSEHGENPPDVTGIMGQDVAEYGVDANVACFRYGGYVPPLLTWQGIDVISTGDRAILESKGLNINRINVDGTGLGAGVAPYMQRAGSPAISVKVAEKATEETELGKFYILRDQLIFSIREWLRTDPSAMLPPDEILSEELLVPTYTIENGKIRIMQKKVIKELLKRSPDRLDALALTFYEGGFFTNCDLT